jgi:polysaccharide pyruvyl transferase WcaK-like protein
MKYFFPIHLNGGNRGCEGIAKGSALILREGRNNMFGLCTDMRLDKKLGVNQYVTLIPSRKVSLVSRVKNRFYKILSLREKIQHFGYDYYYDGFLNGITSDDLMLSTGGDMLCYSNNEVIYTNDFLHSRGNKTALWGCSVGPENMTPEKEATLKRFNMIYTRESLTCSFLKDIGLQHVYCFPDPAFVLQPEEVTLPAEIRNKEIMGLNLSNYVLGNFGLDTAFGQQVRELLDFVLNETDLHICLIPHVTWDNQDDRIVADNIKKMYSDNERITILDIKKLNYCQIRYIISKCRFFIGARTHAVISAYSTCVPSLAIGYSIKSRGIAKDIGLDERLVVDCKKSTDTNELLESFKYLISNEEVIKRHLQSVIPDYSKKPYQILDVLHDIFKY